jgi:L-asparaginase
MIRHAPTALRRLLPSHRIQTPRFAALLTGLLLATGAAAQTPAPAAPAAPLPRLLVITTGGTIGLNGMELVEAVPQLATIADLVVEQYVSFGSSSMRPENWVGLSRRINRAFQEDRGLAGVIVTHGTDTMEETAYFLHLTVKDERPVVITGAMRGPNAVSADGPANAISAARVATSPAARGKGVLVVLNDEVFSARDVRKMDSNRVDAFRSEWGLLGLVDTDGVLFRHSVLTKHTTQSELTLPADSILPVVPVIADYAGNDGAMIRQVGQSGVAGIVVQAFANGRASPGATAAMRDVAAAGTPVALTSRVPEGRVMVRDQGLVIAAGDLSPQKARVLLMLALQKTKDPVELRRIFATY